MLNTIKKIIGILLMFATCYIGYLDFIGTYGNYKVYTAISVIVLNVIFYLITFDVIEIEKVKEE